MKNINWENIAIKGKIKMAKLGQKEKEEINFNDSKEEINENMVPLDAILNTKYEKEYIESPKSGTIIGVPRSEYNKISDVGKMIISYQKSNLEEIVVPKVA